MGRVKVPSGMKTTRKNVVWISACVLAVLIVLSLFGIKTGVNHFIRFNDIKFGNESEVKDFEMKLEKFFSGLGYVKKVGADAAAKATGNTFQTLPIQQLLVFIKGDPLESHRVFIYQKNQVEPLNATLIMNYYALSNPLFSDFVLAHLRKDAGKVGHEFTSLTVCEDTAFRNQLN